MSDSVILRFFIGLGRLGPYLLAFLLGIFLVVGWFRSNFFSAVNPEVTEKVVFEVTRDDTLQTIADRLGAENLVKNSWGFYWLAKLKRSNEAESERFKILAGEYKVNAAMKPLEILEVLSSGKTLEYQLTFDFGLTVSEVAQAIANANLATVEETEQALRDQSLMAQLGIPAYTPEGYLLGGSFSFSRPFSTRDIIGTIVKHSEELLDQQIDGWKTRASELGFRPYEILILASILEEEIQDVAERPMVSSVYQNRLRIGMQLQSNATLAYGLVDKDKDSITQNDIQTSSPYNTYINVGLPPTPICSPSIASIKAALYPADSDSLYFFEHPDGSMIYSATFREHQEKIKISGLTESPKS